MTVENAATSSGAAKRTLIQSVMRAEMLVDILAQHPDGLRAQDLSVATGINLATCHHLLSTLVHTGRLRIDPKRHLYYLGLRVIEHYWEYMGGTTLPQRIRLVLDSLSQRTLETAYIAVWRENRVALLDKVETVRQGIPQLSPGFVGPAHCRASGKVLLAALSPGEIDNYMIQNRLVSYTPNTITDERTLRSELEKVRVLGYALDNEEYLSGWCCVGAPVSNHQGRTVAAITVSLEKERLGEEEQKEQERVVEILLTFSRTASAILGDLL